MANQRVYAVSGELFLNQLTFNGAIIGQVSVQAQPVAGTVLFILPSTTPSVNQVVSVVSVVGNTATLGFTPLVFPITFSPGPPPSVLTGYDASTGVFTASTITASDLDLATVATSGSYTDLSHTPQLPQTFTPILAGSPPEDEYLTGYDTSTGLFSSAPIPGGGGGNVLSVNGHAGAVVLTYTDVGADVAGAASTAQSNAENYADDLASNYLPSTTVLPQTFTPVDAGSPPMPTEFITGYDAATGLFSSSPIPADYLPLSGGTMVGPITGNASFTDPNYGPITGGLSLTDTSGNVINTGNAVSKLGSYSFISIGASDNSYGLMMDTTDGVYLFTQGGNGINVTGDGTFISGPLLDSTSSAGTSGQVLGSTGTGTQWTSAADLLASVGIYTMTFIVTMENAPSSLQILTEVGVAAPIFPTTDPTPVTVLGRTSLMLLPPVGTEVTLLDISDLPFLTGVSVANVGIHAMDVTGDTSLMTLNCSNNPLTTLDASGLTHLTSLTLTNCTALASFDVTGDVELTTLDCNTSAVTTITGLSTCIALTTLTANSNALTTLDISNNPLITNLNASTNQLTQAAVDAILAQLVTNGLSGGTVNLSGGANSAPTDSTSSDALTALGWTVATN